VKKKTGQKRRGFKRNVVIRHASALNYEVKKPRSKQKELADVLKNKRFVRGRKWMVTDNVSISVKKCENNVKNSEHVVVAKQMVDEEQRPRERPAEPLINLTLEEKTGAGDHPKE
jgi:hypothetical protein